LVVQRVSESDWYLLWSWSLLDRSVYDANCLHGSLGYECQISSKSYIRYFTQLPTSNCRFPYIILLSLKWVPSHPQYSTFYSMNGYLLILKLIPPQPQIVTISTAVECFLLLIVLRSCLGDDPFG
jgi:hypothetical protein